MQRPREISTLSNEQGVIFVTVLILSVVLSLILVGVVGLLTSQTKSGQDVVDQIRSEQLAQGMFYRYQQGELAGATVPASGTVVMGSKGYTFSIVNNGNFGGSTPAEADQIAVTINY